MGLYRMHLHAHLNSICAAERDAIEARVSYYNKCNSSFSLSATSNTLGQLSPKQQSAYYYDLRSILRYFPTKLKFRHEFGDVIKVPSQAVS